MEVCLLYTSHPKEEDIPLLDTDPAAVRADAYDMVVNGVEVGGGSIRIHDSQLQAKMFEILGFTPERAQEQFGFLMNAFKYGAPPHGGLAYEMCIRDRVMASLFLMMRHILVVSVRKALQVIPVNS